MSNVVINPYAAGGVPAPTFSFIFDATTSSIWTGNFARATTAAERAVGGDFVFQSAGTFRESHHDGAGTNLGALLEDASTNYCSESFDLTAWATGAGPGATLNQTGIDGNANKASLSDDISESERYFQSLAVTLPGGILPGVAAMSAYIDQDAETSAFPAINPSEFAVVNPNPSIQINTSTGQVGEDFDPADFFESYDRGAWWEPVWGFEITKSGTMYLIPAQSTTFLGGAQNSATRPLIMGHCQLEVGAHASTPIETTGSSVTRNADDVSLATVWPAGAWTVFFRGRIERLDGNRTLFGSTSFASDRIYFDDAGLLSIAHDAATTQTVNAIVGSQVVSNITSSVEWKAAVSYDGTDYALVLDGGAAATATSSRAFGGARQLGARSNLSEGLDGTCAEVSWYDGVALSVAEMQALTT